jgi:hypothetical protein
MGGCSFEFSVIGAFSLVGFNCAASPMTFWAQYFTLKCNVTIGAQALQGVTYVEAGTGKERTFTASLESSELDYTLTGSCPKTGSYSNGTITAPAIIRAKAGSGQQGIWLE